MEVIIVIALVQIALAVICFAKGKPGMGVAGLFIGWFAIFGACRLAKPGSWWDRSVYNAAQKAHTRVRYGVPSEIVTQTA